MSTHFFYLPGRLARHSVLLIYMIHYFLRLRQYFFRLKNPAQQRGFILLANREEIGHNNKDKHGDKK